MIEEVEKSNDLEDIWSFIESIAWINDSVKSKNLNGLRQYCENISQIKDDERQLIALINFIANLALRCDIRYLRTNKSGFLHFTAEQIAWVLSHGFFWWIPQVPKEYELPNRINFTNWFTGKDQIFQDKIEKLMCYFKEYEREELMVIDGKAKQRKISFERLHLSLKEYKRMDDKFFSKSNVKLTKATVKDTGSVEDEDESLIVDFANK